LIEICLKLPRRVIPRQEKLVFDLWYTLFWLGFLTKEERGMSTTISEAARRWGIGRETIYRRHRAGRLNFATTDPPTIAASEMLRVFGEPKSRSSKGAGRESTAALARLDAMCELLKAEGERLKLELASVKEDLRDARADARKERDQLLALLADQQKVPERRAGTARSFPQPSEMTEAEAVLAAQQRAENQSHNRE
jgi:transposase-like protein